MSSILGYESTGVEMLDTQAGSKAWRLFILIASTCLIVYHLLYISEFLILFTPIIIPPSMHLGLHLATMLFFTFLLVRAKKGMKTDRPPAYDIVIAVVSMLIPLYYAFFFQDIIAKAGEGTLLYSILGWILAFILLEAARRTLGVVFTCVVTFFLFYPLFSMYLPGIFYHPGYTFLWIGEYYFMAYDGIFSFVLSIAAVIVIVFLLFSQILIKTGAGEFFIDMARSACGQFRGGPAKMAVVASGFFGMLSGCPVGNVAATGTFTIPLMKKTGYEPYYAGAVESVASLGGMLMPPIMGAIIFILADFIEMPYIQVIKHAAIPAVLYYLALFVMVDQEAARRNLTGLSRETLPPFWNTLKRGWRYAIPVIVLLYLMGALFYTPQRAIIVSLVVLLALVMFQKENRSNPIKLAFACEDTVRAMITVTVAMACAGVIIGAVSVTGVGVNISRGLVAISGGNLLILLLLTAMCSFIMGMGIGPTGCYVFLAVLVVPGLESVGVPLIAAHLFVVYWSLVSLITPPVAVVAYVAAGIADANPFKVGWQASRLGIIAYIVPFAFVFKPALLTVGTPIEIVIAILAALIATIGFSFAIGGYLFGHLNWPRRILCLLGSMILLFGPTLLWVTGGFCIVALAVLWQWIIHRMKKPSNKLTAGKDKLPDSS